MYECCALVCIIQLLYTTRYVSFNMDMYGCICFVGFFNICIHSGECVHSVCACVVGVIGDSVS